MNPILKAIYKDLMKIKKKKGKVPGKDQDKAVKCIRKNFRNIAPADITNAVYKFKTDKLLPDDVCDQLELARYAQHWYWELAPLKALHARMFARNLSKQKVSALVEEINEARAGGEPRERYKFPASCLLRLLPRKFLSDDAMDPQKCFACLLSPFLGTKVRLDCLLNKLPVLYKNPNTDLPAWILATVDCCLDFLSGRPKFGPYLRCAPLSWSRISLLDDDDDDGKFGDILAHYRNVEPRYVNVERLVSCLEGAYNEYLIGLQRADVLA